MPSDHLGPLFRYVDKAYVDSFLATGELLPTTYQKCRTHEDHVRRDAEEGKLTSLLQHGDYAVAVRQTSGDRSYMLCTSLAEDEALAAHFQVDSCIRIMDPRAFFQEVSNVVPGLQSARLGPCEYVVERATSKTTATPIQPDSQMIDALMTGGGNVEELFHKMHEDFSRRIDGQLSDLSYFAKPILFANEREFRMVWTVDEPAHDSQRFFVPKAVQYCECGPRFSNAPDRGA